METELTQLLDTGGALEELATLFSNRGKRLYLVGGPVRDLHLGREAKDLDLATDALPEETEEILRLVAKSLWKQGEKFGTVGAEVADLAVEITTFRKEVYFDESRKPKVTFGASLEEDLARRDFTMNAMAIDILERKLIDPFGGLNDLEHRQIKPVGGDAEVPFTEDPLRMMRAFRFVSQLGFRIPHEVLHSVYLCRDLINSISRERIRDELNKLLLGKEPGRALKLMDTANLLELILPELTATKMEQDEEHRHKDIFSHTLAVIENTPKILEVRLAAVLHDTGKPSTRKIERGKGVSFTNHEFVSEILARQRMRKLKYSNIEIDTVCKIIRLHHRSHTFKMGWKDSAVRRYVHDVGEIRPLLHAFVRADCTTKNPKRASNLQSIMNSLEQRIIEVEERDAQEQLRPELNGHEVMDLLNIKPGREIGQAMKFLMELRLEEGVIGKEAVTERLHEWAGRQGINAS